jgi:hypothetical protein
MLKAYRKNLRKQRAGPSKWLMMKSTFSSSCVGLDFNRSSVSSINSSTERSSFHPENVCSFLSLGAKMTFGSTGALSLAITVASLTEGKTIFPGLFARLDE